MKEDFSSRRKTWTPPERPDWVKRVNEEGDCMDIKGVVPLNENSLLNTAKHNTGLDDFGDDDWYEPFKILIKSIEEEAQLNLIGRLMTRTDLLLYLEARLQIEDTIKKNPEILEQEIKQPIMIIGQGRSGTSVLQNVLSMDPDNAVLKEWEIAYPCPPPEKATYKTDPRIKKADGFLTMVNRVIPEIQSMHEFGADMPMECIKLHCLTFNSPAWFNSFGGEIPSYNAAMANRSVVPVFEYEKKVLKLLQWKNPRKHWLLKSPASIIHIPEILEVFPDMGFVWIHRDPVKALSSVVNLIGNLMWCRSDHPFTNFAMERYTDADAGAAMMSQPIEWIESGVLPKERLCSVQYLDFMKDPMAIVSHIYDYLGIEMTEEGRHAMSKYMSENPRSSRPVHKYNAGDPEQIKIERAAYKKHQDYFNVPSEV